LEAARRSAIAGLVPVVAPILAVERLRIAREGKVILRRLDWRVEPGQHWVMLGPNGAGKSSLLAALTGYFAPTAGKMGVLGETFGRSDWRELRRRIGLAGPAVAAMIQPAEPALHVVAGQAHGGMHFLGNISGQIVFDPGANFVAKREFFGGECQIHGESL
jgi:iron complex transport system ATP-binding protein